MGHHIVDVAVVLVRQLKVEIIPVCEIAVIGTDPPVHLRKDVLEVLDTVVAGLDRIIPEILSPCARIIDTIAGVSGNLLRAITVKRIARLLINDLLRDGIFLPDVLGPDHRGVQPFDGIFIINPQGRRHKLDAFVPRLRHIVEAGIVHNRWSRAILRGESGVPQRIGRIGRRCSHIVHKSQSVTYFVRDHIDK